MGGGAGLADAHTIHLVQVSHLSRGHVCPTVKHAEVAYTAEYEASGGDQAVNMHLACKKERRKKRSLAVREAN